MSRRCQPSTTRRRAGAAIIAMAALALIAASPADAAFEVVKQIVASGEGIVNTPGSLAVDDGSGELYVLDNSHPAVFGFSGQGQFNLEVGYDAVASGPDNSTDHQQLGVSVRASGGTFELQFEGKVTSALPFDASAAQVEAALDALPTIGGAGGSVSVSGGPGDETGSTPYVVSFGAGLAGDYFGSDALTVQAGALTGPATPRSAIEVLAYGGGPEVCRPTAGDVCKAAVADRRSGQATPGIAQEGHGAFASPTGVAVDQATGDLYVSDSNHKASVVQVFSPGGGYIGAFGEAAAESRETVSESPTKIHSLAAHGIAVDPESGDVYLLDTPGQTEQQQHENRLMVFRPHTPGDYGGYEYAGRSHDLFAGNYASYALYGLEVDSHGDIYLAQETNIYEFDRARLGEFEFGKPLAPPTRQFNATKNHVTVEPMAVDPQSGRVIFYSFKGDRYHELNANLEPVAGGEFSIPDGGEAPRGLVFDPDLTWSAGRPAGVLYASLEFSRAGAEEFPPRLLALAEAETFPPSIGTEAATSVGATFATLTAQLNPRGFETTYRFQYGTEGPCSLDPCAEVPLGGGHAGSANADHQVSATISGLAADTSYYFRLLAHNQYGTAQGADASFTTFPSVAPGLPDQRAYELVTPVDKNGGEAIPLEAENGSCEPACEPGVNRAAEPNQAALDGESIAYQATPLSPDAGFPTEDEYLSTRTPQGWRTAALTPEAQLRSGEGFLAFSGDLSRGLFAARAGAGPLTADGVAGGDLYLTGSSGLRALLATPPPNVGPGLALAFSGASADLSRVAFAANDSLTEGSASAPPAPPVGVGEGDLYEWDEGGLALVNVAPGNASALPGSFFGSGPALRESTESSPDYSNAISADGARAFWTDGHSGKLYVREGGERTLEIPDPGRCLEGLPRAERVCFLTASTSGAKVLLSDGRIYEVEDLAAPPLDLTQGKGGFQGILGQSEDLSSVYFVDTAVLTGSEEDEFGKQAEPGQDNLYAYRSGVTTYVATLLAQDDQYTYLRGDWTASPASRTAQVSANDRYLTFMSRARLTSYENAGASEVYLYETATGRLACVSCNPAGVPPLGGSNLPSLGSISVKSTPTMVTHFLTDSGRVFFDSFDRLSPNDVNGKVEDVYEYEPAGVGTCARKDGCLSLISSGHGVYDSGFLSSDETGANVFFTSRNQLVPADQDELVDVYDARESGGFAEASTRPPCAGEACKSPPAGAPASSGIASSTAQPSGNVAPGRHKAKQKKRRHHKHRKKRHNAHKHSPKQNKKRAGHRRQGGPR